MIEKENEEEGFWAVKKAEAIINAHAKLQSVKRTTIAAIELHEKHPFFKGLVVGGLITAAILLPFIRRRSRDL